MTIHQRATHHYLLCTSVSLLCQESEQFDTNCNQRFNAENARPREDYNGSGLKAKVDKKRRVWSSGVNTFWVPQALYKE